MAAVLPEQDVPPAWVTKRGGYYNDEAAALALHAALLQQQHSDVCGAPDQRHAVRSAGDSRFTQQLVQQPWSGPLLLDGPPGGRSHADPDPTDHNNHAACAEASSDQAPNGAEASAALPANRAPRARRAVPAAPHRSATAEGAPATAAQGAPATAAPAAQGAPATAAPAAQGAPAATAATPADLPWLYALVTNRYLFKPCPTCSPHHGGREVLVTYFDCNRPGSGYCNFCPRRAEQPNLLQIRRSTYHEVIKAADIARLTDTSGVQHYVINGSKVLFLCPRPQPRPPKGVVAPARCAVDGRQLMDCSSRYCSLRCKLETEDPEFTARFPAGASVAQSPRQRFGRGAGGGDSQGGGGEHLACRGGTVVAVPPKRSASGAAATDADGGGSDGGAPGRSGGGAARFKRRALPPPAPAAAGTGRLAGEAAAPPAPVAAAALVAAVAAQSPSVSADSGRSSTCRWQHRRKGDPVRAPLQ